MTHASGADSSPLLQESQLPHAACCSYLKSGNRKLGSRNRVIQTTCRKTSPVVNSNRASAHCPCGFNLLLVDVQSASAAGGYAERMSAHVRRTAESPCPPPARMGRSSISSEMAAGRVSPRRIHSQRIHLPPAPGTRVLQQATRAMNRSFLAMMHAIRWEGSRRLQLPVEADHFGAHLAVRQAA